MSALFHWLKSSGGPNRDVGNSWTQFENILKDLDLHLWKMFISSEYHNKKWQFYAFSITFELDLTAGVETAGSKVPITLKFTYSNGGVPYLAFEGGLWQSTPVDLLKVMPSSLPYAPLNPAPSGGAKIQVFISLWTS